MFAVMNFLYMKHNTWKLMTFGALLTKAKVNQVIIITPCAALSQFFFRQQFKQLPSFWKTDLSQQ